MTPSTRRDVLRLDRGGAGVISVLVIGQALLLTYLLWLNAAESLLFILLMGLPIALACYVLLTHAGDKRQVYLPVVMFAAGGFGMLLGCLADFGPLGLYSLLGMCQSWSSSSFWPSTSQLWLMIALMPWACFGMLAVGTAGMMLFDALHHRRAQSIGHRIGFYGVCNAGMFLGMVITEHVTTRLATGLGQAAAGALMVAAMLLGMTLGMSALLAVASRISRISLTSSA